MQNQEELFGKCPYYTAQKILSGKWAMIILHYLSEKTLRFGELKKMLPDITQTTLTRQLRFLEDNGLIIRTVFPEIPPKVEYELSSIGVEFKEVLVSLEKWGGKYIKHIKDKG